MDRNNIVGLIAVHLEDDNDLNLFQKCLETIRGQTRPLVMLGISISCERAIVDNWNQFWNRFDLPGTEIRYHFSNQRQSQFQHYQLLFNQLIEIENMWLLFSDSDDLWDRRRVEVYDTWITNHQNYNVIIGDKHLAITSRIHVIRTPLNILIQHLDHLIGCNADCQHIPMDYVIRGDWQYHAWPNGFVGFHPNEGAPFEYWGCCVRFSVFRDFFRQVENTDQNYRNIVPHSILESRYCDLAFGCFLFNQNFVYCVPNDNITWLYSYLNDGGQRTAFVFTRDAAQQIVREKALAVRFPNI